jgi:hypothetical protein
VVCYGRPAPISATVFNFVSTVSSVRWLRQECGIPSGCTRNCDGDLGVSISLQPQLIAYCLMRNHYHVVVETPNANLVSGIAWLQSTYTIRLTTATSSRGTF